MNRLVVCMAMVVVSSCDHLQTLDKTGTTLSQMGRISSQTLKKHEPANAGSFIAEREGFEPSNGFPR